MNGTIFRVVSEKGFGFIKGEDNRDYFFHKSELSGFFDDLAMDVAAGRRIEVTFVPISSEKGPRASNITRVDGGIV